MSTDQNEVVTRGFVSKVEPYICHRKILVLNETSYYLFSHRNS